MDITPHHSHSVSHTMMGIVIVNGAKGSSCTISNLKLKLSESPLFQVRYAVIYFDR